jgi:hypothetical protein
MACTVYACGSRSGRSLSRHSWLVGHVGVDVVVGRRRVRLGPLVPIGPVDAAIVGHVATVLEILIRTRGGFRTLPAT